MLVGPTHWVTQSTFSSHLFGRDHETPVGALKTSNLACSIDGDMNRTSPQFPSVGPKGSLFFCQKTPIDIHLR